MKREVERERKLPPFRIGVAELEVLFDRLHSLFPGPSKVQCSVELTLKSEKLEFDTVAEIKQYPALKGKVKKFSLWLSQGDKRIFLRSSRLFSAQGAIKCEG